MRTEDLRAFLQIAETGSLTAASRVLSVPKSTLSRRLGRLEEELDAQLLLRTSRAVTLTDVGRLLHRQGTSALAHLEEVERALLERGDEPVGPLRVSAPLDLAVSDLGEIIAKLLKDYPRVDVQLVATNQFVDLIAQGVDVALRIHLQPLPSVTSLRTRRLATIDGGLYASPTYLQARGRPRRPTELRRHACLSMVARPNRWEFTQRRSGAIHSVEFTPRFRSDDNHTLRDAAERGVGIADLPTFLGEPAVRRGTLVRVMTGWSTGTGTLSAVWPATHHTSPRIRAFLDGVAKHFDPPPWKR